jgi:hypothetical protein
MRSGVALGLSPTGHALRLSPWGLIRRSCPRPGSGKRHVGEVRRSNQLQGGPPATGEFRPRSRAAAQITSRQEGRDSLVALGLGPSRRAVVVVLLADLLVCALLLTGPPTNYGRTQYGPLEEWRRFLEASESRFREGSSACCDNFGRSGEPRSDRRAPADHRLGRLPGRGGRGRPPGGHRTRPPGTLVPARETSRQLADGPAALWARADHRCGRGRLSGGRRARPRNPDHLHGRLPGAGHRCPGVGLVAIPARHPDLSVRVSGHWLAGRSRPMCC